MTFWICSMCGSCYSNLWALLCAEGSDLVEESKWLLKKSFFWKWFVELWMVCVKSSVGSKSEKPNYGLACSCSESMQSHFFYMVDRSPWPLISAFGVFFLATGGVMYMHSFKQGLFFFLSGAFMLVSTMFCWGLDIIYEGTGSGFHTLEVQRGLRMGMLLFIVSEVMFFVAFFWAFFHSSLSPTMEMGAVWPPVGMALMDTWGVPLLNTSFLLLSGIFVTSVQAGVEKCESMLIAVDAKKCLWEEESEFFYSAVKGALFEPLMDGNGKKTENSLLLGEMKSSSGNFLQVWNFMWAVMMELVCLVIYFSSNFLWFYFYGVWGFYFCIGSVYCSVKEFFILFYGYVSREVSATFVYVVYWICGEGVYSRASLWILLVRGCWVVVSFWKLVVKCYIIASVEVVIKLFFLRLSKFLVGSLWEMEFVWVKCRWVVDFYSEGVCKEYIELQKRLWSQSLRTLWMGHKGGLKLKNRMSSWEAVCGEYRSSKVQEEDIWAMKSVSYEEFMFVFSKGEQFYPLDSTSSEKVEQSEGVTSEQHSYSHRYAVCGVCMTSMRKNMVEKTWTVYHPSKFSILIYLVLFFVRGVWSRIQYGMKGSVIFSEEEMEWMVKYKDYGVMKKSVLNVCAFKEVVEFCFMVIKFGGQAFFFVFIRLRWEMLFGTLLEFMQLWYKIFKELSSQQGMLELKFSVSEYGDITRSFCVCMFSAVVLAKEEVRSKVEELFCFIVYMFIFTLGLAILFLYFQFLEYSGAYFGISDGIYGSSFYMATGFHGFHVLVGFSLLFVCFGRFVNLHFTPSHHLGLEVAIWYWHFVDGVWILLFFCMYWWGNSSVIY